MLSRLKDLFASVPDDGDADTTAVPLAAAILLLEVAWADHEIENDELDAIREALSTLYALEDAQIAEVVERARQDHEASVGVHEFTRLLTDALDLDERRGLLVHLWRVASFDGDKHHYEEHVIRRITDLLYLNHSDFILAKRKVKSELGDG